MAILTLTFGTGAGLNPEIQVGDIVYYVATTTNGGFTTDGANSIVEIGNVLTTNFSTNVITPGVTSTNDVVWWMREKVKKLGLKTWFHPTIDVQRN